MNSMESVAVVDQSFAPAKQIKQTPLNLNNNPPYLYQTPNFSTIIPRQATNLSQKSQNYAKTPQLMHDEYDHKMMMLMMMHGGLYHHHHHHHAPYHHLTNSFPQQPPLLPFPPAISRPPFHSQPPLRRTQSLSPPLIAPRKAPVKNKTSPLKKENNNGINNSVQLSSGKVVKNGKSSKARKRSQLISIGPNNPDPTRVMSDVKMDMDPISPVFRMAPPPSSLPLPKFTLRKPPPPPAPMKLMRCKAEAAAIEGVGAATDNICMLLKIR